LAIRNSIKNNHEHHKAIAETYDFPTSKIHSLTAVHLAEKEYSIFGNVQRKPARIVWKNCCMSNELVS